jgi:RNA polymerase sigma factor (sigma-70 family)
MNEDQVWVRQTIEGNQQMFAHLVDKYKNKVFAVIIGMGFSRQDAQDLAQEVFIKAYQYLKSYDPEKPFSAWLYHITVNHCRSKWKKTKSLESVAEAVEWLQADEEDPERVLLRKENADVLKKLIGTLAEPYRMALFLRYIDDLSYQEISHMLGIPVSRLQVHLHRAKKKLREHLERKGDAHELFGI